MLLLNVCKYLAHYTASRPSKENSSDQKQHRRENLKSHWRSSTVVRISSRAGLAAPSWESQVAFAFQHRREHLKSFWPCSSVVRISSRFRVPAPSWESQVALAFQHRREHLKSFWPCSSVVIISSYVGLHVLNSFCIPQWPHFPMLIID
jgi:hypothetical protein